MNRLELIEECKKLHPSYDENQISHWLNRTLKTHPNHRKAIFKYPKNPQFWLWAWRLAILACLLFMIAPKAQCQGTSQIDVIQFQLDDGTPIKSYASPFKIRCGTGTTCTAITGNVMKLESLGSSFTLHVDAPLSGAGTSGDHLKISQAGSGADGYLSSTDWNTFNGKQSALTTGNLTAAAPLQFDQTRQVIGGAAVVSLNPAYIPREKLTVERTYYVRIDGSDSNSCLVDSAAGACLTIQGAVDKYQALDCAGYDVTISVADGTYTSGTTITARQGAGNLYITGNTSTPSNVVISTTGTDGIDIAGHPSGSNVIISGFKFTGSTSGSAIRAEKGSTVSVTTVEFGTFSGSAYMYHIVAQTRATVFLTGNYTISGGAGCHFVSNQFGTISPSAITVTLTGTPAFATRFTWALGISLQYNMYNITFSGGATGQRYYVDQNSVINAGGTGANFFPGDSAGETANGGQYI